jgi:hypothetical protein
MLAQSICCLAKVARIIADHADCEVLGTQLFSRMSREASIRFWPSHAY